GFLEHTDHHVGRLIETLEDLEILEDTLVYYIIGDNGASAEGTINGSFNELLMLNGASALETADSMAAHIDEFGTPAAYNHYAVDEATAGDRQETQYFEMFVNRGIYQKGWTAVTRHSTPWVIEPLPAFDDDVWELYGPDDWTQSHDLSKEQPEKLHELQRLFL